MKAKPRARWTGQRWQGLAPVKNHSTYKSPETIAAEVSDMIVKNGLTDVVMIGESPGRDGISKCYTWMVGSKRLWYSKMLEFHALHGRFPYDGRSGSGV
jgi:hypothetical protein